MTTGHFIPNMNFTFLNDEDTNECIDTSLKFITIFTTENLHIMDDTIGAMWYTKWGITNFTRFFTKDSTEQTFFWCWICFTLRCDFTNENVAFFNFSTNTDDTKLVQMTHGFFTNVWNFACNFFWSKLCITCFRFVFFDSNWSRNVIFNKTFTHNNGILEVIPFPSHVGNKWVLTEGHFATFHWRTVTDDFIFINFVTNLNKRALVVRCSWVWTTIFSDRIFV